LLRIVGILSVGMVATLMFTAQITVFIREAVKTPVKEIAKAKPSPPFLPSHYIAWGVIAVSSLAATVFGGPELGAQMALPFGLAATIGGFLIGMGLRKAGGVLMVLNAYSVARCMDDAWGWKRIVNVLLRWLRCCQPRTCHVDSNAEQLLHNGVTDLG
jgi:hypothetical protein